jgi:hypothetical protein
VSSEIDIGAHTLSAGGGALLYGIADRVIRFFRDRDRERAAEQLAKRLSEIEGTLKEILGGLKAQGDMAREVGELRVAVARLEGIEQGRKIEEARR